MNCHSTSTALSKLVSWHLYCFNTEQFIMIISAFSLTVLFTITLIQFHLLWGEFSTFSAAAMHNFSSFDCTRHPSLLSGQRLYSMELAKTRARTGKALMLPNEE